MYPILEKYNYTMVLANVHSFDYQIRSESYNLMNLIGRIKSGDIIICHDTLETVDYIDVLVQNLKEHGYRVLSLSEMSKICEGNIKV